MFYTRAFLRTITKIKNELNCTFVVHEKLHCWLSNELGKHVQIRIYRKKKTFYCVWHNCCVEFRNGGWKSVREGFFGSCQECFVCKIFHLRYYNNLILLYHSLIQSKIFNLTKYSIWQRHPFGQRHLPHDMQESNSSCNLNNNPYSDSEY